MTIQAPAKINLGLNVVSKRADGYHNLETLFVPIPALCDEIEIKLSTESAHTLTIDGIEIEGDISSNLVLRAARLVDVPPVAIHLKKRIPTGAGLGGGSSDAAATLKALVQMFNLGMTEREMEQIVANIGADCPCFIREAVQFGEGIGDRLTPISFNPIAGLHLAIVKPPVFVSTRDAFAGIRPRPSDYPILFALNEPIAEWRKLLRNDFEETVLPLHPEIAEAKRLLYDAGALYAQMSGSGAAVFGLFKERPELQDIPEDWLVLPA